jgi:hypothetical protein
VETIEFFAADVCIFCLRHRRNIPLEGACTYGLGHEFPERRAKQVARPDAARCARCGLHPKNPASAASECAHEYRGVAEHNVGTSP